MYRQCLSVAARWVERGAWHTSGPHVAATVLLAAPSLVISARSYAAAAAGTGSGSHGNGSSGSGTSGGGANTSASASSSGAAAAARKKKKKLMVRSKGKATPSKATASTAATAGRKGASSGSGTSSGSGGQQQQQNSGTGTASSGHASGAAAQGSHGSGNTSGGAASSATTTAGTASSASSSAVARGKRKAGKVSKPMKKKSALKKRKSAARTSAAAGGGGGAGASAGTTTSSASGGGGGSKTSATKKTVPAATSKSQTVKKMKKSASSSGGGSAAARLRRRTNKKIRVCVLNSSYAGINSETAAVDNYWCTPQHYAKKDKKKYAFADVSVEKSDSYRTVRELVTSGKHDIFFNLCDGAKDERRAGVDVVQALEEMNAAFTGADSHSFEPSKIDMKLLVGSSGVQVPNFVLLENTESLAKKCRHLRFPVIVKHLSGYASVGIHKDNRCDNLEQLKTKVISFIKKYNHAMVEEFIRGSEGTVLACADAHSPHGVKVFRPLMFKFLQGADDFAYFDKKWAFECSDEAYGFLPTTDPSYEEICEMARNAYKYIMNGVGYGRVDFRIDEKTNKPYFLEINPNCGMWYSEKDGGDFADIMVQGDNTWNHERFVNNAISHALREQAERKPWYFISHDKNGQFSTRASKTVPAGKCLFGDAIHPIPVISKALFKLGAEEPTVGCVICRGDGIHQAVAVRHSCEPNMAFVHGRTLLFAAKRQISVGEELTVDYSTLRDESMPPFACGCGTEKCRSMIFPMPASSRTVEGRGMKKILREKKRLWMQERKADKEAENILKKRSHKTASPTAAASASSAAASNTSSSTSGK